MNTSYAYIVFSAPKSDIFCYYNTEINISVQQNAKS